MMIRRHKKIERYFTSMTLLPKNTLRKKVVSTTRTIEEEIIAAFI